MAQSPSPLRSSYRLLDCTSLLDLRALRAHFETLPQDPYVPQGFRYKQIVRCRVQGADVAEQAHAPLFQSGAINPVHGDLVRDYERFPRLDLVSDVVRRFARICGFDQRHEVLVQPHRITCSAGSPGEPALEGFHRDGIHFLAILCVSREGIVGGETQLSRDGGQHLSLRRTLAPGELLVFDDRDWLHYTSSIQATGAAGHRDVLLLSSNPHQVNRAPAARPMARAA